VKALNFSPDSGSLLVGYENSGIAVLSSTSAQEQKIIPVQGGVNDITFAPDGKTLVVACSDNTLKILDAGSGNLSATLTGFAGAVNAVAYSPDAKYIASGSDDKSVRLWSVQRSPVATFTTAGTEKQ
ncbi:MAG TPA: hypothetical protein VH186_19440, partial [Chloroflexia bacterium]|nr:hypothetical protein [Chloroflexia bacterium]